MARVPILRAALAILALVLASSCGGGPSALAWEIRAGDTMPRAIRLEILRGGCDSMEVVWSDDVTPSSSMTGTPPALEPGTYCLRARGVDDACALVGWARTEVTLPRRDGAPVVLLLARDPAMSVPPLCASEPCTDPLCESGARDGGPSSMDAGVMPDALSTDASMDALAVDAADSTDVGRDAGRDAFTPPDATGCMHGGGTLAGTATGIRPWSGWTTGVLATGTASAVDTTFVWSAVSGATCYELQRSDACEPGSLATCTFAGASTEISTTTSLVVALDATSSGGAAGRRWTWRVRGCSAAGCSSWGSPRYLDVARSRSDVDGDGTADLVLVGPHTDRSLGLAVMLGGPSPRTTIDLDLPDTAAGVTALGQGLTTCDIDGDGYHEIIAAAPTVTEAGRAATGRVYVFRGPPRAGDAPAAIVGQGAANAQMGASVACGDVDADGFADVIVGGPGGAGRVEVHLGASAPLLVDDAGIVLVHGTAGATSGFGTALALGDVSPASGVQPDGIVDLFVGAPSYRGVFGYRGAQGRAAFVTTPSPASVSPYLDGTLRQASIDTFGESLVVADFDSVLGADIAVGAPANMSATTGGAVYFASLPTLTMRTIARPSTIPHHGAFGARFGIALAVVRSADPSVYADLLIGAPGADRGTTDDVGAIFRVPGTDHGPDVVPSPIFGVWGAAGYFGRSVAADVLDSRGGFSTLTGESGPGAVWGLDSGSFVDPFYYRSMELDGTAIAFGGP